MDVCMYVRLVALSLAQALSLTNSVRLVYYCQAWLCTVLVPLREMGWAIRVLEFRAEVGFISLAFSYAAHSLSLV